MIEVGGKLHPINVSSRFSKRLPTEWHSSLQEDIHPDLAQISIGLKDGKSPGQDGFSPYFFKKCWSIVGSEMTQAFQ